MAPADLATPLVSVVIPTCRRPHLLSEALESVFSQTFTDFEVLVVEDGSHDAPATLTPYGSRVRYVWQPAQGVAVARNTGVAHARGQWIAFLDDDDLWLPEKLALQIALVRAFPGLGLVHTHHHILQDGRRWVDPRVHLRPERVPSGSVTGALFLHNFVVTSSTLVARHLLIAAGGFRSPHQPTEDYDLWLRLSRSTFFGFIGTPLVVYRVHGSALTADPAHNKSRTIDTLTAFLKSSDDMDTLCERSAVATRLHQAHLACGRLHLWQGQYAEARRHFLEAWRWERRAVGAAAWAGLLVLPDAALDALRGLKRLVGRPASWSYARMRRLRRPSTSGTRPGAGR